MFPTRSSSEFATSIAISPPSLAPARSVPGATLPVVLTGAGLLDYVFSRLATTFTVVARITAPNKNEMSACRSTWWRISDRVMSVSDTWNVMPTVNAV